MIKKLKGEILHENKWMRFHKDTVEFRDGHIGEITYMDRVDSGSMIIPLTDDNHIILVREWRYAIQDWTYCFPFGGTEHTETALDVAQRELHEETGYLADTWERLGEITIDPGANSQVTPVFLARDLRKDSLFQNPDMHEIQEVCILSLEDIQHKIATNEIRNGWLLAGFAKLQAYLEKNK